MERKNEKRKQLWRCGLMVMRADSRCGGCEFESYKRRNKNAIGEEGNGKPPHIIHFRRKKPGSCLWFLLHSKSSMRCRNEKYMPKHYRKRTHRLRQSYFCKEPLNTNADETEHFSRVIVKMPSFSPDRIPNASKSRPHIKLNREWR